MNAIRVARTFELMQTVVHTPRFTADAKAAGVTDREMQAIETTISADPGCGSLIRETGGLRKVRIATEGGGKSGGYRVFYFFAAIDVPIFLFRVIAKGQRENISKAERNVLKAMLPSIETAYRAGVTARSDALRARRP